MLALGEGLYGGGEVVISLTVAGDETAYTRQDTVEIEVVKLFHGEAGGSGELQDDDPAAGAEDAVHLGEAEMEVLEVAYAESDSNCGKSVGGMNIAEVASLVRGKEGTVVQLELIRKHRKIIKNVKRRSIKIESVKSSVKNDIGYIQISSFIGTSTSTEFLTALEKTKDSKGLILDLRGNTGGLLANAIFIANMFLDNGTIVNIVSRDGKIENIKAQHTTAVIDKPVVILVDGASASASEILSGALKDHHKAVLVGTRTFGKGMVQRIIPLPNSTGLNLTIAKYLTPNGSDINKKGITPDYIVNYPERDVITHKDPQREKAERILTGLISK